MRGAEDYRGESLKKAQKVTHQSLYVTLLKLFAPQMSLFREAEGSRRGYSVVRFRRSPTHGGYFFFEGKGAHVVNALHPLP